MVLMHRRAVSAGAIELKGVDSAEAVFYLSLYLSHSIYLSGQRVGKCLSNRYSFDQRWSRNAPPLSQCANTCPKVRCQQHWCHPCQTQLPQMGPKFRTTRLSRTTLPVRSTFNVHNVRAAPLLHAAFALIISVHRQTLLMHRS